MKLRVGILQNSEVEALQVGKISRNLLHDIPIGLGFHWQQNITMQLPGELEVIENPDGSRTIVNIVDLEDYLECVISSEMSPNSPLEYLKAHAIISRSWVMGKVKGHGSTPEPPTSPFITWEDTAVHEGFDVCADDHCQRYQGRGAVNETVREAISQTAGLVLTDLQGNLCDARFSKCCGGRTELFSTCWQDRDYDYLQPVDDPYCGRVLPDVLSACLKDYDRHTDFYDWTARVNKENLRQRISERYGRDLGRIQSLRAVERGASGRIKLLEISGEQGPITIGKELAIRRLLAADCLYSSRFEVEDAGEDFILRGRGWGHGVGLCQIGAAQMAAEGKNCEEILSHYYPNTKITSL